MAQVARIDSIFAFKDGQNKREPRSHYSRAYPTDVLFKLLRCGACGSVLLYSDSRGLIYRQCKNAGSGPEDCQARTRVPAEATKRVLTEFVASLLGAIPDWLNKAIASMNETVRAEQTKLPAVMTELSAAANRPAKSTRPPARDSRNWQREHSDKLESQQRATPASFLDRLAELDHEIGQL